MDMGVKNYKRNAYPRVGIAWRLNEKTVFRAGFGMSSSYRYFTGWQYPVRQQQQYVANNSFVAAGSMAQGFPAPVPVLTPSNGIITNAPNQNYSITPTDLPVPYVENWNVALQRTLPANLTLDLTYVGNHAVKIANSNQTNTSVNINAATTAGTGTASEPLNILFGRTATTTYPYDQSGYYGGQPPVCERLHDDYVVCIR